MFGYVKPVSPELLVREYEFYRAVYCGICRSMRRHTGIGSTVTLSYDSVFLALVRMLYLPDSDIGVESHRCIAHPVKKRAMLKENSAIEYTARAFAILTYYKIRDDISDEGSFKKLAATAISPITASAKNRAGIIPLEKIVHDGLAAISALEEEGCASVDRPAEIFGDILGEIFCVFDQLK